MRLLIVLGAIALIVMVYGEARYVQSTQSGISTNSTKLAEQTQRIEKAEYQACLVTNANRAIANVRWDEVGKKLGLHFQHYPLNDCSLVKP